MIQQYSTFVVSLVSLSSPSSPIIVLTMMLRCQHHPCTRLHDLLASLVLPSCLNRRTPTSPTISFVARAKVIVPEDVHARPHLVDPLLDIAATIFSLSAENYAQKRGMLDSSGAAKAYNMKKPVWLLCLEACTRPAECSCQSCLMST